MSIYPNICYFNKVMVISNFTLILCQFIWNDKGKAEQQLPFLAFACYFFQFPDHMIYYHYPIILIISCNWWVLEYHIRLSTVLKWKYAIRPVTCSRYVTSSKSHRVNFKWCESIFCNAIQIHNYLNVFDVNLLKKMNIFFVIWYFMFKK